MVDFGTILKQLRLSSGLTQKELAEKIGITKSVISYYELQERTPSPEILVKLASIFNVTTDYLLGIERDPGSVLDTTGLMEEDIQFLRHTIEFLRKKNRGMQSK